MPRPKKYFTEDEKIRGRNERRAILRRAKGIPAMIKYQSKEEKVKARIARQAAIRRAKGIPVMVKYSSDEERVKARKERRTLIRRQNGITGERKRKPLEEKLKTKYKCDLRWRLNNREKVNELVRQWQQKNKGKVRAGAKRWRENNKDKVKITHIKRRQRKKNIYEKVGKNLIQLVFNKFNNKCFKCNSDKDLCMDHHYPLIKGFALTINNAVLLCRSCNSSKRDKLPESFYSPEQLTDLQLNYGISKSPIEEKQPSLFEARMPKNLERDNGLFGAMNAA